MFSFITGIKGSHNRFALLPTIVTVWSENYSSPCLIWLRYYTEILEESEYLSLSSVDDECIVGIKYVISRWERR